MSDIGNWFSTIPLFTRYWFGLSIAFSIIGKIGIVNGYYLMLGYNELIHGFQIWRPVSAMFYYPINPRTGFHWLVLLYFLYTYSVRLETGLFGGRPADYLFMLIFNWICCVIIALFFSFPVLMDAMVLSVLYVWCQVNRDVIVNFWFGTQFKAVYLPWVLFIFNMIIGGGGTMELIGIVIGHVYFFLMYQYPQEYGGQSFLQTPQILYNYFPNQAGGTGGFGQAPASARDANPPQQQQQQQPGRHNWGRGQQLGRN